ncbi:MAG: hypothetical protein ACE5EL_03380, partial [Anaerolineae bacterium]
VTAADVAGGAGSCSTGTPGEPLDRLTCGLGTLENGESRVVTVSADVSPSLPDGTILENDVRVFSDRFDLTNANDYATSLVAVDASADLAVTKTDQPDPVVAGELLEYTITVDNLGPSDAQTVYITDTLPAAVSYQGIRDPFGHGVACSLNPIDEHTLTCSLPDIPAAGRVTFTVVTLVAPNAPAQLDNAVTTTSLTPDPCATNNTFHEFTGVDRAEQLFVFKDDFPDAVIAGTELTYTILFGNTGPSTATSTRLTDTLPVGVVFDRCESLDINNLVTCSVMSGDGITTPQVVRVDEIRENNVVVYTDLGTMDPGISFTFLMIADVSPGYVLDDNGDTGPGEACETFFQATGYPHFAHNRVDYTSDQGTVRDDECTRVESLADLDIQAAAVAPPPLVATAPNRAGATLALRTPPPTSSGGRALGSGRGYDPADDLVFHSSEPVLPLQTAGECSPVSPGERTSWRLTITNNGPSDAADVLVTAQLPAGVVHDPATVVVEVAGDLVDTGFVDVRDDGLISVQLCRLNVLGVVEITITTRVRAETRGEQILVADVMTVLDSRCPVRPGRPTMDPVLENNVAREAVLVMLADISVRKTVAFNGQCPGSDGPFPAQPGQPVTYCLDITNTGDTYLDQIEVVDTLHTRLGERVVFTDTITSGADPFVPVAPGETVTRSYTIPALLGQECGHAINTVQVQGTPTNAGRTVFGCVLPATATDRVEVDVPCAGVDFRLQLPALQAAECQTWIQVQNVGDEGTKALLVFWGDPSFCPPQSAGPLKVECSGLLRPGAAWSFAAAQVPVGAASGIAYSLNATDLIADVDGNQRPFADVACGAAFRYLVGDWERWQSFDVAYTSRTVWQSPPDPSGLNRTVLDFAAHPGQPLALTVNRSCPDPTDPNVTVNATYTGISSDEEGARDPLFGGYTYYAPLVMADAGGLSSWLWIQNSGIECTSLEIWFKAQDNCLRPILGDVLSLAPGESIHFDPNTVVGPGWIGSAWIRGSQPLGLVVDTLGPNHFTSTRGLPGDVDSLPFTLGTQVNYAPLLYSEQQGWDSLIQVQNLSATMNAKVKVYFLD